MCRQSENLLNSSISPTFRYNMLNFGPLAAEICWRVWGTAANFNGFRVLAALLHRESKNGATLTMAITLSILDSFATFFLCYIEH